jgi:Flp pilus assembly protein TadG
MSALRNWISRGRCRSGQALVEFLFVVLALMVLLFGMIDFCRALSTWQVMVNISREGSNLAARGNGATTDAVISNALGMVITNAAPLNINTKGKVIISAVLNTGKAFLITDQIAEGPLAGTSKIGSLSNNATMPFTESPTDSGAIPQPNQTLFVTEVFYSYTAVTPVGRIVGFTLPTTLYDAAYF